MWILELTEINENAPHLKAEQTFDFVLYFFSFE